MYLKYFKPLHHPPIYKETDIWQIAGLTGFKVSNELKKEIRHFPWHASDYFLFDWRSFGTHLWYKPESYGDGPFPSRCKVIYPCVMFLLWITVCFSQWSSLKVFLYMGHLSAFSTLLKLSCPCLNYTIGRSIIPY